MFDIDAFQQQVVMIHRSSVHRLFYLLQVYYKCVVYSMMYLGLFVTNEKIFKHEDNQFCTLGKHC